MSEFERWDEAAEIRAFAKRVKEAEAELKAMHGRLRRWRADYVRAQLRAGAKQKDLAVAVGYKSPAQVSQLLNG
jgi:hypothetical protein